MRKIKKGDKVIVISGKDKGKSGIIKSYYGEKKIIIEGVNQVKKHQKPNPTKSIDGGIMNKDMPIDISNIAIFNPVTGKGDRVGFRLLADGRKIRFFKATNEVVDL